MSKRQIALMIALMFAVPAGVVALEQSAEEWTAELPDPVSEILATAAEPVTEAQPAEAETQAAEAAVAQLPAAEPEAVAAPVPQPREVTMRYVRSPVPDEPGTAFLPRQLEYLERLDRERSHLVARGDVFPAGNPMDQLLPAQVAYLDRIEQVRLAAAQPAPVATAVPASGATQADGGAAGTEALIAAHASAGR